MSLNAATIAPVQDAAVGMGAQSTATDHSNLSPRTRWLLEGPVFGRLITLAAPNVGEAVARITFIVADAWFVSWLGAEALAGVSVVFPLLIIMQTVTASGLGAGVSSAVGRALGAGHVQDAQRLAGVAIALALSGAAISTALMLTGGPGLYRAMGLTGPALDAAIVYSLIGFSGCVLIWLQNIFANICRGAGNMIVPASAIVVGELAHLSLSPTLIMGWGPFPQLGVAGAGVALLSAYAVGALIIGAYLVSPRALARLRLRAIRFDRPHVRDIMRVGLLASISALLFQLALFFVTGMVGRFGNAAIAGYGAAARLDLLQAPITFAFGSAVIAMVATAVGARDLARARHAAWAGMIVAAGIGLIFTGVALNAESWMALFTADPVVARYGVLYLHCLLPIFPILGAGFAAYFACQGLGDIRRPFVLSIIRFSIAIGGGWLALRLWDDVLGIYLASAFASLFFSVSIIALAIWAFRKT